MADVIGSRQPIMHHLKLILCTLILSVFGAYASDAAETQVAAGAYHGLLLDADGQVWAWGGNAYGQIGINSTGVDQPTPQTVKNLGGSNLNRMVQVAAGSIHSLGLRDDGTVWGWGYNAQGQIGRAHV